MTNAKDITVSIQGYEGSFHHIAAMDLWGKDVKLVMRSSFAEVFDDLVNGKVSYSLAAVENTIAGAVVQTLDLLQHREVTVIGEIILKIHQNLIVIPGTKIEELREVHSHPVALEQCLEFLDEYPHIMSITSDDTGRSVATMMKNGDKKVGSIASTLAAEIYKAEVLVPKIETDKENRTRFFVLSTNQNQPPAKDGELKTSMILEVPHVAGSLAKCLAVLAENNCNLLKIESRPIKGRPWEYSIYIDMSSNHTHQERAAILVALKKCTVSLKVLGTYVPGEVFDT